MVFKELFIYFYMKLTKKEIIGAIVVSVIMLVGCVKTCEHHDEETTPVELTAAQYNVARASELCEDIFKFIALIEGDKGEGTPYFCGAAWTVWYGVTYKPDGTRIKQDDAPISKETGKEWCIYHIENRLVPFFCHFDNRRLTDGQIIGCALFMYNVGAEEVTGYNHLGQKLHDPSKFFCAVNEGEDDDYCVNLMTRYRRSAGKRANGLLKRHWVQGAAYKGILDGENILDLRPEAFYKTKNMGNYYWLDGRRKLIEDNGVYQLRYDDITINTFFNMNLADDGQKSVLSII